MSKGLKSVKSKPLAGRIKKVMQTDEDVGKIAQGGPVLMCTLHSSPAKQFCSSERTPDGHVCRSPSDGAVS